MNLKKRILVAPLNWGIGHATRCIPIINALLVNKFEPIIASDGIALHLLQKEFPNLKALELPSYNIRYPKKGHHLKLKLLKDAPQILKAIRLEHKLIKSIINDYSISGIISDNRFGVYHETIPSIFITHQLNVLSGSTTWFSSKINQNMIQRFDECWVPDAKESYSLSGRLSDLKSYPIQTKYTGILSRFKKKTLSIEYDLAVVLSGPEPQRSKLETNLLEHLKTFNGKVIFVRGIIEDKQLIEVKNNFTLINYMQTEELETTLNKSEIVISRSGYSTILDLAKLQKKAFFIPTPGQFEQEYLAEYLEHKGIAPFCKQNHFTIDRLKEIKKYSGFTAKTFEPNFKALFSLF